MVLGKLLRTFSMSTPNLESAIEASHSALAAILRAISPAT
jgi:hypothetical protein